MRNMAASGTVRKDLELDCLLFFPPVGFQFVTPEIGLPQLVAYLNAQNIKAQAYDLNYIFISNFIPQYKELISKRVECGLKRYKNNPFLKAIGPEGFIRLNPNKRLVSFSNFIYIESIFSMSELLSLTGSTCDIRKIIPIVMESNDEMFDLFFNIYIKKMIRKSNIIGFSVLDVHQLTSVLYLSKLIKQIDAKKKIVIGGPWCICSRNSLRYFKGIFKLIDFVVTTEGEIPLKRLVRYLKDKGRGRNPDSIGGLAFLKNNNVIDTGDSEVVDLNTLPLCNFENFGLTTGYCSGRLPVMMIKGCYWGRCKFCYHSYETDIVRAKSVEKIVDEIEHLKKRYDVKEIDFADSSSPVGLLIKVAKKLISKRIDVRWNCLLRVEACITLEHLELLKRSGCTGIAVGLECADQESLDRMGKGIDLKVLDRLLDNFLRADLKIKLFIMNYPNQTKREYIETWNYILSRREKIPDVIPQGFRFGRNTYFFSHRRKFKIKQPADNKYNISSFSLPYECETGMSKEDFFNITVDFSRRFYEMRDNYKIVRRIFQRKKKRYLLLRPPTLQGYNTFNSAIYNHGYSEPVSLLKIGAFLKNIGHSVEIIDCLEGVLLGKIDPVKNKKHISFFKKVRCGNFEKEKATKDLYRRGMSNEEFIEHINKVKSPDEIYITSQFNYEYDFIKAVVTICRKEFPKAVISLGGVFATLCPDKARNLQCDVFVGLFHLVDCHDTDLSLLNYKTKSAVIKFSRGCQNSCKYCSVPYLEGKKTYFRPIEMVISEILTKYRKFNIRKFIFWESNAFGVKNNYLEKLLDKIIELKLDIELRFPEGLQPNFISKSLARKMKLTNVKGFTLSFESCRPDFQREYQRPKGSQQIQPAVLNLIEANVYTPFVKINNRTNSRVKEKTMPLGTTALSAFLLIGLPRQTKRDVIKSIIEVWKCGISVCFTPFTPIPHTKIFKDYEPFLHTKQLSELYPLVWPFATEELTVNFLENILTCDQTSSFFQIRRKSLLNEFKVELQQYVDRVDIHTIDREIATLKRKGCSNNRFRIIDLKIKRNQINLKNLGKIRDYISELKRNKSVFYLYKPIPKCIIEFGAYWYKYSISKDCDYCLKLNCTKRQMNIRGTGHCKDCKYLNNPCKNCFCG